MVPAQEEAVRWLILPRVRGIGEISGGRHPWSAGTKGVPLPTATQFRPLRGWGAAGTERVVAHQRAPSNG